MAQQYAVLPLAEHSPYARPCGECKGLGITGDRFEMPTTDTGPILLVEVICPECGGCGNGDPDHADCPRDAHAYPDEFGPALDDDDYFADDLADVHQGERCPSCGTGRGWNAVQGFSGEGENATLAVLRMPCGCSESRLVLGSDPAAL